MLCISAVCFGKTGKWDLQVSPNQRFLQYADGTPFFWLGDTGWLLPTKLDRDEVKQYLAGCRENGFNVVQVQTLCDVPCVAYSSTSKAWYEAQCDSGYTSMKYLKALMLSLPFFGSLKALIVV